MRLVHRRPRFALMAKFQLRVFIDGAVGLDHDMPAMVAIHHHRDGILEQGAAHERQDPMELFKRVQHRELARIQYALERGKRLALGGTSAFGSEHGQSPGCADSLRTAGWP